MKFYLGTHLPNWLTRLGVPLFPTHPRMSRYRTLPKAVAPWALDSGGFTELQRFGSWDRIPPATYVAAVHRYHDEIGLMDWCAPQDWMCERVVIDGGQVGPVTFVGTHLSVEEHQRRTIANGFVLRNLASGLPWRWVLQGQSIDDYFRHIDMHIAAGIDLTKEPLVGLGSVCRRQATGEIATLVETLAGYGLRLHGFGVKTDGLRKYGRHLASADSLAWSFGARHEPPMPGCTSHKNCANCPRYALAWRHRVLAGLEVGLRGPEQMALNLFGVAS